MKFGDLITGERELLLRSLAFCGVKVIVPLSNENGRFNLSEIDLDDKEIVEIHLMDIHYPAIVDRLLEIGFVKKAVIDKKHIFVRVEENLNVGGFTGVFEIGDIVIVNSGLVRGITSGEKAIIFYQHKGVISLITEKGITATFENNEKITYESLIFLKKCNNIVFNKLIQIKPILEHGFE